MDQGVIKTEVPDIVIYREAFEHAIVIVGVKM